jgi:hypothetical protein
MIQVEQRFIKDEDAAEKGQEYLETRIGELR